MNWDAVLGIWDEFLAFMDRVMQWLQYVFKVEGAVWPPEDYPNIDDEKATA